MDEMVIRAMAKWPDVPAVFGWLRLDRRGRWWIRDELVSNPGIAAFIGRNYLADASGRYFFQNGPQQVFVALDATPWVFHLESNDAGAPQIVDQTGQAAVPVAAGIDEEGNLYLQTGRGFGIVDERELVRLVELIYHPSGRKADDAMLMEWLAQGAAAAPLELRLSGAPALLLLPLQKNALAVRFGFIPQPG
ncbi:MAG: DUF2946 family protein [Chitinivorax sp.]